MTECIFCKIVNKEAPAYVVYEDENVIAFLDIFPVTEGHTLVIPKKHYSRLSEMPEEDAKKFIEGLHKVINIIESKISKDYNILANQGKLAGQEIMHLHFHIIPRYGNEQLFIWNSHRLTEDEVKRIFEKLQK